MTFEAYLAKHGWDIDTLTPQQLDSLESAWRRETNAPPTPTQTGSAGGSNDFDTVMSSIRSTQAQGQRITELVKAAAKDHPGQLDEIERIGRSALAGNWNETQVELALLRAVRPSAPSPLNRGGRDASAEVIECALARTTMGSTNAEQHYSARTLEQADRQFKGGLSIGEVVLSFARQNGYADASLRGDLSRTLQHALLEPRADVGPSTYSLSGILSNMANKGLRDDFMAVEQEWRKVASIGSSKDFKEYNTYNLVGDLDFKEVGRGGKLEHGTLEEEEYANQVKQHGRLLVIDRPDLINDDLSAFVAARRRIGRGAGTKLNKVFWAEWNNLANFNTAALGNYDDGADSAFSENALNAAYLLFTAQTDPDGEPLGVEPKLLVVGPSNRIAAIKLMTSTTAAAGDEEGDANPWSGLFEVVASQYMASTALGGLSTQWHLVAAPSELPVIEVSFLNGIEVPTVNEAQLAADRLGLALQAFLDFGVRRQERRARVSMKGQA